MEVYVLDSLLRRTQVFDKFDSLIWTERFSDVGDFELDLKSTYEARTAFRSGVHLAMNNSNRVMTVDTVEDSTDTDDKEVLKVKGLSLEDILADRVAVESMNDLNKWTLTGIPGDIARQMFQHICADGSLDPKDRITFLQPGSLYSPGSIPETQTPIVWEQDPDALYTAIKSICDIYDLGFRLYRNQDASQLYFDIYSGDDRTTRQTDFPPVVFAVQLDSIQNTTEFSTSRGTKNVAYVFSPVGFEVVYGENVDPDVEGFERHVLGVNASDIAEDNPDISGALIQRGLEELNKNRALSLFDGELNQYNQYKYGVDYNLGDLVEVRNRDGEITYKRVTEQIFVHDEQGERSYPTLAIDLFAGVNTWLSWNKNPKVWSEFLDEHWADM